MRTPIRTTFAFQKEPFGRITVTPRRNCTRVIIKRRPDNSLAVSVPYGYDFHALDALLSEHSSQIANTRRYDIMQDGLTVIRKEPLT